MLIVGVVALAAAWLIDVAMLGSTAGWWDPYRAARRLAAWWNAEASR